MEKIVIEGKNKLYGDVCIGGMKNSALPIIFACILIKDECIIENVPMVSDTINALEILRGLGAEADFCDCNTVRINAKNITNVIKNQELVSKMRASCYLMGTLLSRFGYAKLNFPGGCNFGSRPIEQHFHGFSALGAKCIQDSEMIEIRTPKRLKSKKITPSNVVLV